MLRDAFRRKLLEVLFDGRPEADADIAAQAKSWFEQLAAERKLLTVPADAAERREARAALRQRRARRDRGPARRAGHGVRLRRVEERGGLAARTPTARFRS